MNKDNNASLWRMGDNTFIKMEDMENEHLQKAIYFSENKLLKCTEAIAKAEDQFRSFQAKRAQLLQESSTRSTMDVISLIEEGPDEYKNIMERL